MNILVVSNKFPYPPKDGGQIATFAMIRGFAEAGHSVTVASINTPKHFFDINKLPASVKAVADFRTIFVNTDLTIKGLACNFLFSRLPYTATRFITNEFANLLKEILSQKTFDIVQLEGLYMCAYIPTIRKFSKTKISYRAHNVEFEIWQRLASETSNFAKHFYLNNLAQRVRRFECKMLNKYDFIVPITQRDAENYNKLGNTRPAFVAPAGIFVNDLPQFAPTAEQEISLFHLGALDWSPNQQGLIWFLENCWEPLKKQNPTLKLYVAGRNAPQWFIEKIKINGVEYVGEVPDAYKFMSQHTIMIVPLLAGGGMRIKILEGLSYGKVIVSTSIGAEGIDAQSGKEIIIADTAEIFVNSILNLINDRPQIASIEQNAKIFIRQSFDNKDIISRLQTFYGNKQ